MIKIQDLDGNWELAPIPSFQTRPDDESKWLSQTLPAHWQQHPQLRHYAGYLLYRKRFDFKPKKDQRVHLELPGIFYWSTVFFNDRRLGDHEGYFTAQRYDVTDLLQKQNELLIVTHCPDQHERNNKRMITGVFSHWDCLDPTTNPGGIWLTPALYTSGETYLDACLFQTDELDGPDATVSLRIEVLARATGKVNCTVKLEPENFKGASYQYDRDLELDEGRNKFTFCYHLEKPELWWTHDRGRANLYRLTVTLKDGRKVSDEYSCLTGIRTVRLKDWICYLNNQRLYLKGNNLPPTDTRIATVEAETCRRDLDLAKAAHLNILRVHAHVDHPMFYEAADRAGMLLWQDFPLQWSYQKSVLPVAERMIRDMVRLLFNHPAVAVWCCHNEPIHLVETKEESPGEVAKTMWTLFVRGWNRDVLDAKLKQAAEEIDNSRTVNKHSGEPWTPWQPGTDTHFYFGWYRVMGKSMRRLDSIIRISPKNLRFVTEFGAQSFPHLESCLKFMSGDIQRLDWRSLERQYSLQKELMEHWIGLTQPDLATLIEQSQTYQARLNRFYIDRIRRAKYQPNGGVIPFMFTDPNPAVQWSVIDYWRVPKASYYALRDAMRPVYPFAILSADVRRRHGRPVRIEVYLVNDTLQDLGEVTLTLTVTDQAGRLVCRHQPQARVAADGPAVHFLTLEESPETPGIYKVAVTMDHNGDRLENLYTFSVE